VLGGGGVVGASWMVGALQALDAEAGFRAQSASRVLGTSAGALVGALAAAGVSPEEMGHYASGTAEQIVGSAAGPYSFSLWPPPLGFGSPRLAAAMLRQQRDRSLGALVMGLLPRGVVNPEPIARLVERVAGHAWPSRPKLRVVACDYASGQRVTFGSRRAPDSSVGDAVAASCAIPALFQPVRIGERSYIDGGIHSHSNLDLIAGEGLDLVVCLSPMSSSALTRPTTMLERIAAARRRRASAALISEARGLRARGTQLLVLEPSVDDIDAMGANPMARDRAERVIETARETVARTLRRVAPASALSALASR
ncbi:MAG TPA: patatin-like phospholipase family protein, partial [Solirubrobacteraceae bacterium]|nr:patatin-like phospholipase family protein [Solirubrobacteraceae bacterium]